MLDEEWLKSVRSDIPDGVVPDELSQGYPGCRITGLAGIGSTAVVLSLENGNGEKFVYKMYHNLCFFVKELPPFLAPKEEYDIERINQKLWRLVGNPLIDEMCREYNRLYSYILKFLYDFQKEGQAELGVPSFCSCYIPNEEAALILHTPGIQRRLNELALLSPTPEPLSKEELDSITVDDKVERTLAMLAIIQTRKTLVDFNTIFPCLGERKDIISWAKLTLETIASCIPELPYMKPHLIAENPLYVWGAAVMDGLVVEEAMPAAVAFIEEKYGRLANHPNCAIWISQLTWIANLYVNCLSASRILLGMDNRSELVCIKRFKKFCLLAGYLIPVYDEDLDINHIASAIGLSVEEFQRIQQQVTGESP